MIHLFVFGTETLICGWGELRSEPRAAHVFFIFQIKKELFIFIFQIKSISKGTFWKKEQNGRILSIVNGFFGLRCRLQVNKSVPILIQSRQSCCNLVQSSIVKFLYNPVQSIQSKHNWGTHRGIVPKTGISWQTTWGSNPTTIAKAKLTFQNGSMQGSDQPKSLSLHFHNPPQSRNYFFTIGSDCERIMWLQQRQALILICNFTLVTIEKTYFAIQSDCVRILD